MPDDYLALLLEAGGLDAIVEAEFKEGTFSME